MITLKKGNPNKLEGRVIVYSKPEQDLLESMPKQLRNLLKQSFGENYDYFSETVKNNPLIGIFCTKDPIDIIEFGGRTREEAEQMYKTSNSEAVRNLKLMVQRKNKYDLIRTPIPLNEEKLAEDNEGRDILFTGNYFSSTSCIESIIAGSMLYELRYAEQKRQTNQTNPGTPKKQDDKIVLESGLSCDKVPNEHFKDYISGNFVSGLVDAKLSKNTDNFFSLKREFIKFGTGSTFQKEIERFCDFISSGGYRPDDEKIRKTWLDKIYAIKVEDFGAAAKYRNTLEGLIKNRK